MRCDSAGWRARSVLPSFRTPPAAAPARPRAPPRAAPGCGTVPESDRGGDRDRHMRSERGSGGDAHLPGSRVRGFRRLCEWVRVPARAGGGSPVPREGCPWRRPSGTSRLSPRCGHFGLQKLVMVASEPFLDVWVPRGDTALRNALRPHPSEPPATAMLGGETTTMGAKGARPCLAAPESQTQFSGALFLVFQAGLILWCMFLILLLCPYSVARLAGTC